MPRYSDSVGGGDRIDHVAEGSGAGLRTPVLERDVVKGHLASRPRTRPFPRRLRYPRPSTGPVRSLASAESPETDTRKARTTPVHPAEETSSGPCAGRPSDLFFASVVGIAPRPAGTNPTLKVLRRYLEEGQGTVIILPRCDHLTRQLRMYKRNPSVTNN